MNQPYCEWIWAEPDALFLRHAWRNPTINLLSHISVCKLRCPIMMRISWLSCSSSNVKLKITIHSKIRQDGTLSCLIDAQDKFNRPIVHQFSALHQISKLVRSGLNTSLFLYIFICVFIYHSFILSAFSILEVVALIPLEDCPFILSITWHLY